MDVTDVLELLEQRAKEHRDRASRTVANLTPEERIAAQIDSSIADEYDAVISEIRTKALQPQR